MSTKRNQILSAIKTTLESISTIKTVEIGKSIPNDISNISLPAVFVYSGPSTRVKDQRGLIGYETFDWIIVLEVWAEDTDMEELLGTIHTEMAEDDSFGGLVELSEITGTDIMLIDPEKFLEVIVLEYSVLYKHAFGSP